jgi:hypothetical protein
MMASFIRLDVAFGCVAPQQPFAKKANLRIYVVFQIVIEPIDLPLI